MATVTSTAAPGVAQFTTTHWSVVLQAGSGDSSAAAAALEQLCRTYWYPLYAYVRRRGSSPEDAQDLTQQFFALFLQRDRFSLADPARGRFRTFLLSSFNHFLADDWKRAHRVKRGAGASHLQLDALTAEQLYASELTDHLTPERLYDERWAMALLDQVLDRTRDDYARAGKEKLFDALQDFIWGPGPSLSYTVLAKELGLTETAARAAVHRMREHYRERLRAEVAQTLSDPAEVDAELRYLISVIRAGK